MEKDFKELVNGVMISMNVRLILVTQMQHVLTMKDPFYATASVDFLEMVVIVKI